MAFAGLRPAETRVARREHDEVEVPEVQQSILLGGEVAVVAVGRQGTTGTGADQAGEKTGL